MLHHVMGLSTNIGRYTPLHQTCDEGRGFIRAAQALSQACPASVRVESEDGWTPLHFAAYHHHVDCVRWLLRVWPEGIQVPDSSGMSLLSLTIDESFSCDCDIETRLEVVLLIVGVNPEAALWADTRSGMLPIHRAAMFQQAPIVRALIDACPSCLTVGDEPVLHHAVKGGSLEIVEMLLDAVPDSIRCVNSHLQLPLHVAVVEDQFEMVQMLVQRWPESINMKTRSRETPKALAAKYYYTRILKYLERNGAE